MTRRVAIAATGPSSLEAGRVLARAGGNAVDCALAAAMTTMATEPGIVSLSSGGFVSVWEPDREPVVIDGNVEMPGRGVDPGRLGGGVTEISTDYGGGVRLFAGHGSVATHGSVAALQHAVEEHGSAPWREVCAPAAAACREGYRVGAATAYWLGHAAHGLFAIEPETHALVTRPDGDALRAGDVATNPALADAIDVIARDGSSALLTGELGRALVADQAAHGGLVTARDLAEYAPLVRTPVRRRVGDWDVAVNPPPSVGGPMLALMLGELARRGDWHWPDVIDIQRRVLRYRLDVHDLSHDLERDGYDLLVDVERYGLAALPTSANTANVSAVDSDGLACAVTVSSGYGAGICIPGTGLILNNSLGEVELNRLGLHAVAPGTRLASNMAPSTARTADGRVLAVGSPGADRITTALMQVLGQGCLHDADLRAAVEAPRLHVTFDADGTPVIQHERDTAIAAAVRELGLRAVDHGERSMYFGGVGAAYRRLDGELEAAGDPRREAAVAVV